MTGARVERPVRGAVHIHQIGQQLLIERTPVGPDPHRLVMFRGEFDDRRKLFVLLVLEADIAGIDAVFRKRLGAGGIIRKQLVADVVEIADQRDMDALAVQLFANVRDGCRGLVAIDGDADDLRARLGQRRDLKESRFDVRCVRVGHRLHDNRRPAADRHGSGAVSDTNRLREMARGGFGGNRIGQAALADFVGGHARQNVGHRLWGSVPESPSPTRPRKATAGNRRRGHVSWSRGMAVRSSRATHCAGQGSFARGS